MTGQCRGFTQTADTDIETQNTCAPITGGNSPKSAPQVSIVDGRGVDLAGASVRAWDVAHGYIVALHSGNGRAFLPCINANDAETRKKATMQ